MSDLAGLLYGISLIVAAIALLIIVWMGEK
jgi:hypothetical protein